MTESQGCGRGRNQPRRGCGGAGGPESTEARTGMMGAGRGRWAPGTTAGAAIAPGNGGGGSAPTSDAQESSPMAAAAGDGGDEVAGAGGNQTNTHTSNDLMVRINSRSIYVKKNIDLRSPEEKTYRWI